MRGRWRIGTLLILTFALARSGRADEQFEWNGVERIVAVGDVHGAYDNFVAVLKMTGLVDEKLSWIGGDAHLVQNGDVVDRGPHSRKAMDLLMELEGQARKAGGFVHPLVGNHEAMNVVGILDLVSKEEFDSYTDRSSVRLRDQTFERYYEDVKRQARSGGEEPPDKTQIRAEFDAQYPLGYIEHRQAFAANGRYGKWIRGNPVAVKINGIVFSHGDWSEKLSVLGVEEVNRRVRAELKGESPLETGITFDPESPLQYRGLAHIPLTAAAQQAETERVSRILANLGARRMVVGHTLTSGAIESRFGGKHISIDTGMLELYHGGHRIALEIQDDVLRAVHEGGEVAIPETMDETNFEGYLREVAAVDPENVDVQLKFVDALNAERRTQEAAVILERLLQRPENVPFRYREILGAHYEAKGDEARAEAQYRAYIAGLGALVDASPDNVNLAHLLVRFCIEKNLELERAETTLARILEREPSNVNFALTRARLQIARREFHGALDTLSAVPRSGHFGYEGLLLSGLAYLGLNETERAREAFEDAIEVAPDRVEAREELKKLSGVPLFE
jgi:tetratricopeptide (TPR) repeat protein